MKVGFIGIGTMGTPMIKCLLDAGHEVTVHDLKRDAAESVLALGAKWGTSPKATGESSDAVFTSLPGPSQVKSVVLDPEMGLLKGLKAGKLYVDLTTNSPMEFRKIAARCSDLGIEVLDSPVSHRPPEMTMMVGGSKQTFEKHKKLLEAMGKHIFYVGDIGSGMVAKLMTQYMGYTFFITMAEAFLTAAKAGVDVNVLADIVPHSTVRDGNSRLETFRTSIFTRAFDKIPERSVGYNVIAKDLTLACELAQQLQAPVMTGMMSREIFQRAEAAGLMGTNGTINILEQMANFKFGDQPKKK